MTNREVVQQWARGIPCRAGSLSTDGRRLYSYALEIGFTGEDRRLYVRNYTVSGQFISQTTSCHVGLARRVAFPVEAAV